MKKVLLAIAFALFACCANSQGISSFFTQQDTKDKLMIQQIVELKIYESEIKKGYAVTQAGLNTANELKTGTFSLHKNYFNSLSAVSPSVKSNPEIGLITSYQLELISSFDNEITWQKQQAILGSDEISYMQSVYNNILTQCSRDLDELKMVVDPGTQMTDEQREKRIDLIYNSTSDKYVFSKSFTSNAHLFAMDRRDNKQQLQVIKKLYDIN